MAISPKIVKKLKYGVIVLLLVLTFYLLSRKIFFITSLTLVAAYLKYKRAKMRIPISGEPVLFLSMMLTRVYGIQYSLILIVICVFIIDLLVGDITISTIIAFIVLTALNILSLLFSGLSIPLFGVVVSVMNMASVILLQMAFGGVPPDRMIIMPATGFLINMGYFLTFGELLSKLMV